MENTDKVEGNLKIVVKAPAFIYHKASGEIFEMNEQASPISEEEDDEDPSGTKNNFKMFFVKSFRVSLKYKFKLIFSTRPQKLGRLDYLHDKRPLIYELIHCGTEDIKCQLTGKIYFMGPNNPMDSTKKRCRMKAFEHNASNFVKFCGKVNIEEKAAYYLFELKIEVVNMFNKISNIPFLNVKRVYLNEKKEMYQIIAKNKENVEVTITCPREDVAKCGDILVRQFENAMNAEKPLRIEDHPAETVKAFFEYIEKGAVKITHADAFLMKMAHMYHITDLFHICDRQFAETRQFKAQDMERTIKFADTFESIFLAKAISEWHEENPGSVPNWEKIISQCPNFLQMVGKVTLKIEDRHLNRFALLPNAEGLESNIWIS